MAEDVATTAPAKQPLAHADWYAEGLRLFGADEMDWRFVCPSCGHVASTRDYKRAGASVGAVGYSCVGRWMAKSKEAFSGKGGPCNYAGGGLLGFNPLAVIALNGKVVHFFDFDRSGSADA